MERHVSVLLKGEDRKLEFHDSFYHCPFCAYKGAFYLVENHVKGHSTVSHREFTIIKCGLGCRKTSHFHCCYCHLTIINRAQFIKHLQLHDPPDGDALVKIPEVGDAPQTQPGAPQTHLDAPQTQPDVPQTQPNVLQTKLDAPQTQPDTPKTQPDAPQTQSDAPQTQQDAPQTQQDAPQTQPDTPLTQPDTPQTQPDAPQTQFDAHQTQLDTPQAQQDTTQTQPDTPQTQQDAPQTQPDARQIQPDARHTQEDAPQTQPDAPQTQQDAPQTQPDAPQTQQDDPQTQPDAPQTQQDAPQTQPDAPQTQQDDPQTQQDDPQTQPDAPQTQQDDPQTQPDAPQTQQDDPQTQPDAPQTQLLQLDAIESTIEITLQQSPVPTIKVTKTVTCPHCNLQLNRKNFKMHLQRKHTNCYETVSRDKYLACECIDMNNGVFAVVKNFSVPATPVHVIKNTCGATQTVMCEVDQCRLNADVFSTSGMPTFECQHIKSILFCPPAISSPVTLSQDDLETMVENKWFGESRKVRLLKLQEEAEARAAPLSVRLTVGGPATTFYVSVFEPVVSHSSKLGRVVTEYDSKQNRWRCPCSEQSKSCIHKATAKWHLFTTENHLFRRVDFTDSPENTERDETQDDVYPPSDHGVERMLRYISTNKKLPAELPQSLIRQSRDAHLMNEFPMHLIPRESRCEECHHELGEPTRITADGRILASTGVCDGISTYRKTCGQCHMTYRYQEWEDGVHNFDDHVILSLHLCLMMRNALQTHTAISRLIEMIEATESVSFPNQETVLQAYLHFEALSDHDYLFACVSCGNNPSVVVMDLHKAAALSEPVSEPESPPEDYDGHVDVIKFWDAVTTEMLSRGLIPFGRKNPFVVPPSFHHWSPWIGPQTRRSNVVFNTEFKKLQTPTDDGDEQQTTAERLSDELLNLKQVEDVRELSAQCGLDSDGSRTDLVLRLQDKMSDSVAYNKVLEKMRAASGGWAVVACPCGVVCSVKFTLRAASPRDYADLLLSWKHFPNVTVYDHARRLAEHTNRRQPDTFRPFAGRLANLTPLDVKLASEGKLHVNIPWLKRPKKPADIDGHPITGSSERFALSEDDGDVLRKVELVPDLAGRVDRHRVERLFEGMRENDYFLNTATPSTHMFLQRNILHHYNNAKNQTAEDQYNRELKSQECKRRRERIRLQEVEEVPPKKSHDHPAVQHQEEDETKPWP